MPITAPRPPGTSKRALVAASIKKYATWTEWVESGRLAAGDLDVHAGAARQCQRHHGTRARSGRQRGPAGARDLARSGAGGADASAGQLGLLRAPRGDYDDQRCRRPPGHGLGPQRGAGHLHGVPAPAGRRLRAAGTRAGGRTGSARPSCARPWPSTSARTPRRRFSTAWCTTSASCWCCSWPRTTRPPAGAWSDAEEVAAMMARRHAEFGGRMLERLAAAVSDSAAGGLPPPAGRCARTTRRRRPSPTWPTA